MNDEQGLSFRALELAFLAEHLDAIKLRHAAERHVTVRPDGSVWGWGQEFDTWREHAETCAAYEVFPPRAWWRHPDGRRDWQHPPIE